MRNHNLTPRWAQASLAIMLLLIGIGGGGLTMALNIMYGASHHWTMAVGFALTDAAKITIPLAAYRLGPSRFLTGTFLLCLTISIWAALNCWLTESGHALLQADKTEESRTAARKILAEAERGLAAIAEQSTAEALAGQIQTARQTHKAQVDLAAAARITCAQRTKCLAAQADLAKLQERHGQAQARDELKLQRTAALETLKLAEPKALGAADTIATFTGIDRSTIATADSLITTIAFIAAMECLVVLSFFGAAILGDMARRPAEPRKPMVVTSIEPEQDKQTATLARLLALVARSGHYDASLTELAETLDARRSTLHDWTKKWKTAGQIHAEPGPDGRTRFKLPASRAIN